MCTEVTAVRGNGRLESITIRDQKAAMDAQTACASLFIFIGAQPTTDWLDGVVARDANGFVLTGTMLRRGEPSMATWPLKRDPYLMETSLPGVFCVGDVRAGSIKRVASAAGQGGIAVEIIHQYLAEN
jgi:thioredoxin reductase (NADPH)